MMYGQLFMVEYGNVHVVTNALTREEAGRRAERWMHSQQPKEGSGSLAFPGWESYTITPLTAPGDRIKIDISLSV